MTSVSAFSVSPPLRVLHVITGLGVGGAESMLTRLATLAPPSLLTQRVVALVPGGPNRAVLEQAGIGVADLGMTRGMPSLGALRRLAAEIRDFAPDVVQSWMYHADLCALAARALSGCSPRLAWGVRCSDMDTRRYGPLLRMVIRACALLSGRPDAVVANSVAGRDVHLGLGYAPRRFEIIPNGIDVTRFRPDAERRAALRARLGIAADRPLVAQVARVDPMKDYDGLLAALDRVPEVDALLIGAGTEDLPAGPRRHRLGRRSDVADLLCAADVIVSSSAFGEGFSNALAEGMACGLPAVTTDVGDARLVVGDSGLVVPPGDPAALADAIRALATEDAAQHAARAAAARAHVVDNFAIDVIIRRFAVFYADLVRPCAA